MAYWDESSDALSRRQRLQLWWFWSPLSRRLRLRFRKPTVLRPFETDTAEPQAAR